MNEKKVASITAMGGPDRYDYFVRKVADFELLYGLFDDGWAMMESDDETRCFPFWPESEFAELLATERWKNYRPKEIELATFLGRWIPGMTKDGLSVAVFPTPTGPGVVVKPDRLAGDLAEECSQYE